MLATACETNNINPYDYADPDSGAGTEQGSADVVNTALAQYPKGSIVWTHDTTLTESVEIAEGASLYIEPGVTVTCKADVQVPVELVVLGNLYCMGTAEKPVVFTSDLKKPASWGGIVCGYNSQEVVLAHVDLAYAGATPTESSPSFQNKLYKTTIDGGLPAFHFCNTNGRLAMVGCFMHNNYNDQTYFGGGQGVIYDNIMADSGNAADGGEGINIKAGCKMDVANNVLYNICTNGFKLSNQGNSETVPLSQVVAYNNTIVNCGWRRSKNKKGGSVWIEKAIAPVFVGNLIYDCRFGMKQPAKNGADIAHSTIAPNYYFASTETGVEQMGRDAAMAVWSNLDIKSTVHRLRAKPEDEHQLRGRRHRKGRSPALRPLMVVPSKGRQSRSHRSARRRSASLPQRSRLHRHEEGDLQQHQRGPRLPLLRSCTNSKVWSGTVDRCEGLTFNRAGS